MQIESLSSLPAIGDWLTRNSGPYSLDLETTGLDQWKDKITHVVLGNCSNSAVIGLGDSGLGVASILGDSRLYDFPLIFHNAAYDLKMLYRTGLDLTRKEWRCTMLMHHLLDPDASHALDSIVQHKWSDDYKAQFWSKYTKFEAAPLAEQTEYAGKDGVYTAKLYRDLCRDLGGKERLIDHTHRLARALLRTEVEGVRVDLTYLANLGATLKPLIHQCKTELESLERAAVRSVELDLHAKAVAKLWSPRGKKWQTLPVAPFNWGAPKQLQALLYDKLKLPPQYVVDKKTREKRLSVDDDSLEALENVHPLPKMLREYAGYQKVFTAFVEGTLSRAKEGRIYPRFNVNGTVTGRISSEDPNLQQLPSKGEWAKVRGMYIPDDEDSLIVSADFGQIEVIVAAHFSRDPNLLRIVLGGESKHDITAAALGVPRSTAKTLNFAMQYQCGPGKVSDIINIPQLRDAYTGHDWDGYRRSLGRKLWSKYWDTYAGERRVADECGTQVDMGDPIETPWGRSRQFPLSFPENWMRNAAKRQAYSTLIQGTAADLTHYAFYTIAETLEEQGWGRALWEVHDQVVCSVKKKHVQEASDFIKACMEGAGKQIDLSLPLKAEIETPSERWTK